MTTPDKPAVTVLGLGTMGTALASTLLEAGHPVTVWNRTSAKTEPLVANGAARAESPGEAIAASRLVLVCLLDHASVHDVLDDNAEVVRGRTVVNLTNGTPVQARELATWAACQGTEFLDGGIMAVPPMIGTPAAFVLYSGSREVYDRVRNVLDRLGDSVFMGTEPGQAALHDLALLSGMYGMFMGILHSLALIRAEGRSTSDFAPMLTRWLTSMAEAIPAYAEQIDSGDYGRDVVSNVAMQANGYGELLRFAEEQGVSPELLAPLGPLMRRRVEDGHGHEDLTGVVELLMTGKRAIHK